ncbi:MAG: FtsX-like permease family protein, partial [Acidobacteriota bacterium]
VQLHQVSKRGQARRWSFKDGALVVQTALCCVLLICSFVAVRGLMRSLATRPGLDLAGVSVVSFDPALARYSVEETRQFQRRSLDAIAQLPGVIAAAYSKSIPLMTDHSSRALFREEDVERKREQVRNIGYYNVSPGYFGTMGTRLIAGRDFAWTESQPVAIVNETMARQFFGPGIAMPDAAGKHFRYFNGTLVTVIGVVEDGKYAMLAEDPKPIVFQPIFRSNESETVMIVRSKLPEAAMAAQMARTIKALDPTMPLYGVGPLRDQLALAFLPAWIASIALGAFGVLAAMLCVTGIYGLASYSVSRRRREIGIRMAIGARPAQVLRAVLGRLAILVAVGSVAGIGLGLAAEQLLSAVVYQASSRDLPTLAAVAAVMLLIAAMSAFGPVRRAISVDPNLALRQD